MTNRPPVPRPQDWACPSCLDMYYFGLVMQLDHPKGYLKELDGPAPEGTMDSGMASVRAAGGLK